MNGCIYGGDIKIRAGFYRLACDVGSGGALGLSEQTYRMGIIYGLWSLRSVCWDYISL